MTVTKAHQVDDFNKRIGIECNEPRNRYRIGIHDGVANGEGYPLDVKATIRFQHGPLQEAGINGITEASLLAVVLHRYELFQDSGHSCAENVTVMFHLRAALEQIGLRSERRKAKGIEGTNKVDPEAEGQKSAPAVPGTPVPDTAAAEKSQSTASSHRAGVSGTFDPPPPAKPKKVKE